MISADSSWDYREWNMEVLSDLKNSFGGAGRKYLDKYIGVLKGKEESESRARLLVEASFDYVCDIDSAEIFRKRR
ncbi:MAG: hypothetical protein QXQ29_01140 [Candidatus Bathyarchaeia archaeon]